MAKGNRTEKTIQTRPDDTVTATLTTYDADDSVTVMSTITDQHT